uniref:Uncharacterized protein n=1 Tax=Arundo donax TaxID=35708 RepID=A0A0A8Z3K1_ARUDO
MCAVKSLIITVHEIIYVYHMKMILIELSSE